MKFPVPANLLSVIKILIPPKGIRRDFEGSELLDYVEDDPYLFEDKNKGEKTSDESESEDENDEGNAETQAATENQSTVEAPSSSKIPSLANIAQDPLMNKNAKILLHCKSS